MKKYKVVKNYYDTAENLSRWEGMTIELEPEKAKRLIRGGFVEEVSKTPKDK